MPKASKQSNRKLESEIVDARKPRNTALSLIADINEVLTDLEAAGRLDDDDSPNVSDDTIRRGAASLRALGLVDEASAWTEWREALRDPVKYGLRAAARPAMIKLARLIRAKAEMIAEREKQIAAGSGGAAARGDTTKRKTRRIGRARQNQREGLTDRDREAWTAYARLHTFTAVGDSLGISRQAATKLIESAERKINAATNRRSARTQALPTGGRGESLVTDE